MSNHGLFNQLSAQTLAIGTLNDNQATGHEKIDANNTELTALNTKLDSFSGHTNNTITIGDGSTQLRTVPLGYDRSNGKAVSFLVDAAGHQQVDAVDVTAKIDTLAGAGNNNIGEGSSKLQIYNYGRDVSAGNYKPMVVNSSAEQIVALSAVDNAVLDTIATNTANINVNVGDVEINVADLETLQTATNSKLDTIDSVLDTIKVDSAAIKTAVELIDNTVSGSELQVDIVASALPAGGSTAANQATLIGHVDGVEGKLDILETTLTAIETDQAALEVLHIATNSKLDTIDSVLDTIKADSASIKTAVELLDNTVSGSELQVDVVSVPTTTVTGTVTANLSATDNAVLDDIAQKIGDVETAVQLLDNAVSGNELQVDVVASLPAGDNNIGNVDIVSSALPTGAATQTTLAAAEVHLGNIDTGVDVLEACVGSNKVNVNISSGNISGFSTSALQGTTNTLLTTLDGVVDNILSKNTDAEAHLGNIDTGIDVLEACVGSNKVNVNISSGTVTANLSATDNAVLDDIAQKIGDVETAVQAIDDIVKAEDAAHSSGDKGVMFLGVRQDSQADFGADGDYVPLSIDADGKLRVAAAAASGGATEAKQDVLETTLTAIETDMAAIEVLITATNSKIDTFDAVLDASLVKQTNLETLITTLDGVQDNVLTKLGEVDAVLDNIKVDTEAVETAVEAIQTHTELTTVQMFDAETVNSGGDTHTSSAVEIIKSPANGLNFLVRSSSGSVDAGDFTVAFLVSADNSNYSTLNTSFKQVVNDGLFQQVRIADYVPKFIKMTITNNDFSSNSDFTAHLFY